MKSKLITSAFMLFACTMLQAQQLPIDTATWSINARSYVIENFRGSNAIYLQGGSIRLKNKQFLNGTIEFDIILKEEQAFPGVIFRVQENGNAEEFYVRPHQSGNPDANQAGASFKNITPWQLLYGERYSFPYKYKFDDWTHVKILVNDNKAQVFLDHSHVPNLSWNLFHEVKAGDVIIRGGNQNGLHIANIQISDQAPTIENFEPIARESINGLVQEWSISDMFNEELLNDPSNLEQLISDREWQGSLQIDEGTAVNISRLQNRFDGSGGNTVFAKITISSDQDQLRLFEFGYSDRVVAILNGKPLYWGNNRWRSRDYRYLGTIGLFDGIYLDLKKGENTLLMAVSEDFGGWLITGRFKNTDGLAVTAK